MFLGDRPAAVSCLLPLSSSLTCSLVEPTDDDEDEPEGGVIVEPFAVYGPKGK
jgi:hypothetical protein